MPLNKRPRTRQGQKEPSRTEEEIAQDFWDKGYRYILLFPEADPLYTKTMRDAIRIFEEDFPETPQDIQELDEYFDIQIAEEELEEPLKNTKEKKTMRSHRKVRAKSLVKKAQISNWPEARTDLINISELEKNIKEAYDDLDPSSEYDNTTMIWPLAAGAPMGASQTNDLIEMFELEKALSEYKTEDGWDEAVWGELAYFFEEVVNYILPQLTAFPENAYIHFEFEDDFYGLLLSVYEEEDAISTQDSTDKSASHRRTYRRAGQVIRLTDWPKADININMTSLQQSIDEAYEDITQNPKDFTDFEGNAEYMVDQLVAGGVHWEKPLIEMFGLEEYFADDGDYSEDVWMGLDNFFDALAGYITQNVKLPANASLYFGSGEFDGWGLILGTYE